MRPEIWCPGWRAVVCCPWVSSRDWAGWDRLGVKRRLLRGCGQGCFVMILNVRNWKDRQETVPSYTKISACNLFWTFHDTCRKTWVWKIETGLRRFGNWTALISANYSKSFEFSTLCYTASCRGTNQGSAAPILAGKTSLWWCQGLSSMICPTRWYKFSFLQYSCLIMFKN